MTARAALGRLAHPGIIPVAVLLVAWWLVPTFADIPPYKAPEISQVAETFWRLLRDGTLWEQTVTSLTHLAIGVGIGVGLGLVVGFAVALSARLSAFLEPPLVFFQSIAGIAWIPLAIVWFGFGSGPVVFVIANGVFFVVLLNTVLGVESIPPLLRDAVRTLGGSGTAVLREVIIPGALTNVLVGLRVGLGFGWKALVAAEVIVGGSGLGYMGSDASRRFDSPTVIVSILVIGLLWLLMDRALLRPLEARTVERWGIVRTGGGVI